MKRTIISLFAVALLISSPALAQGQGIEKSDKVVDTKFVLITSSLVASTVSTRKLPSRQSRTPMSVRVTRL